VAEPQAIGLAILVLVTVGLGLIAPPVGLNVLIANNITLDMPMSETDEGVFPFLAWDALRVMLLRAFPLLRLGLVRLLDK
jgi:TRAP-type C4-dicarboxylate transport system permease large subunit